MRDIALLDVGHKALLGEILVTWSIISQEALAEALRQQMMDRELGRTPEQLGAYLTRRGMLAQPNLEKSIEYQEILRSLAIASSAA